MSVLQRLEGERESFADVVNRDGEWESVVGYEEDGCELNEQELLSDPAECGISEEEQRELIGLIQNLADLPDSDLRAMQLDQDRHVVALMRMLTIDLALRSCRELSASFPGCLSSLIPEFLAILPSDPFTGAQFIYRRISAELFHLYSAGPKGFDGGGNFGPWPIVAERRADLCLDENDFWSEC